MTKKKGTVLFVTMLALTVLTFLNEKSEGLKVEEVFISNVREKELSWMFKEKILECDKTNIINYYDYNSPYMFVKLNKGVNNANGILYRFIQNYVFIKLFL